MLSCEKEKADPGWKRVRLRYLDSTNDVLRVLAGLHLLEAPPSVLAVDASLVPSGPGSGLPNWELTLARLAATLADCTVRRLRGARSAYPAWWDLMHEI